MSLMLAIESAVAGGSLSLLDGRGAEIAFWIGDAAVARSEELLSNIDNLVSSAGVEKSDLTSIAVSAGPGSFTGIRGGIATALGLKDGLGIPMYSASVLKSMVTAKARIARSGSTGKDDKSWFCSAIPSGRGAVCVQLFEIGDLNVMEKGLPMTLNERTLEAFVDEHSGSHFLIHSDLFQFLRSTQRVSDIGRNLAYCVAQDCFANRPSTPPLFVSKSF
jgi:tRNA threonylcarbamoyladenosine biosynthesis protein TsaB